MSTHLTYRRLLAQRELRDSGASTGIDAEYIACHYLLSRGDFKWALKWDDLKLPSAFRWQRTEYGIDVVAEHIDGSIWALQVKDYQKLVGYGAFTNMSAFVASGRRRGARIDCLAILCADAPASRTLIGKCAEENTVIFDSTDLAKFSWPTLATIKRTYKTSLKTTDPSVVRSRLAVPKNAPKKLWTHQRKCLAALRKHFASGANRARVYMVTGAGKTVTFVKLAEDYDIVLVIVPRLLLAQQTYEKFIQQTGVKYDHILFVASENVGRRYDDLKPSDLTGRNSTDVSEIAEFVRLPGRKLIISTYKSSERIKMAGAKIDLAIFDEAHHVAGFTYNGDKPKQAQALLHYRGIKRHVFFTATPRVYTSDIKKAASDGGHYVASLDNAKSFGPLVYEFSYDQALNAPEPVVKPYEIHLVVLNDEEYREALRGKHIKDAATRQNVASPHIVAALAQAKVVSANRLRHGIGFANSIDNANRLRDYYNRFGGNHFAETLSSLRTVDDNKRALMQFEESSHGFITNVNILSEGMDAPCIDYIVFADPMQSQHAIAQKIGRGLRYDPDYPDAKLIVIVPIILEADNSVGAGKFQTILEVLGAMSTMDKTLEMEIKDIARNLPSSGYERRFKIDADIPLVDIEYLEQTIATTVFSPVPMTWWVWLAELKDFIVEHGRLPTKRRDGDGKLGRWIMAQRARYRGTKVSYSPLSRVEVEALESLGDVWVWGQDEIWSRKLDATKQYFDTTGQLPSKLHPDSSARGLSQWLILQRAECAQGKMSLQRQEALAAALPEWQTANYKVNSVDWWAKRIYSTGDIYVPDFAGTTVYSQAQNGRHLYRSGKMSKAEQARCRKQYPTIWKWLVNESVAANSMEWWASDIYCFGDAQPRRSDATGNWYYQCIMARKFYRAGEMSREEQSRCRNQYPAIWEWLTLPSGARG
jgi:superfamily II DNA or RNA helicase